MHNPVLPAVDIIIACHRFPSEEVNGRARQDKGRQGRGRRKWGSVGDTITGYGDLFKYVGIYIRGDFSGFGPLFPFVFLTPFFVSCQTFGLQSTTKYSRLGFLTVYFV